MKLFFRLLFGITIAEALALGQPSVVLAHEGEVHPGGIDMGIPIVVLWVGGGLLIVFLLFFFIGWTLSKRAKKRSQREETERNIHQEVKEEK